MLSLAAQHMILLSVSVIRVRLGDLLDSGQDLTAESSQCLTNRAGGVALYNVGSAAAVQICVVHFGGGDDVLAQVALTPTFTGVCIQGAGTSSGALPAWEVRLVKPRHFIISHAWEAHVVIHGVPWRSTYLVRRKKVLYHEAFVVAGFPAGQLKTLRFRVGCSPRNSFTIRAAPTAPAPVALCPQPAGRNAGPSMGQRSSHARLPGSGWEGRHIRRGCR